jgi:hypothetical protein
MEEPAGREQKVTRALIAFTALLISLSAQSDSPSPIDPEELSATVKALTSDAFQGRAPGTAGDAITVAYLIDRFKSLGLEPGGEHGSWTQQVSLIHNVVAAPSLLEVRVAGSTLPLRVGRDINPQTLQPVTRVKISRAPIVFVGYGVAAPERDWDDFKGVDLRGKVALFLINEPDF